MHVRRGSGGGFRQDRVVVKQHARGTVRHPCRSTGRVVRDIPYPVDRPSDGRLVTERMGRGVHHQVSHDANVVQAAIDFDRIVMKVRQVVVIEINGDRPAIPVLP